MRHLQFCRWVAFLTLAIALAPSTASAQDADTLSISGTFNMDELREYQGTVGTDLAEVFARDNEHWWSLTLYGVTYSHDYYYSEYIDELGTGYDERFVTRVHATSFDFQFVGPDADVLNEIVSQKLVASSLGDDVFLALQNGNYFDPGDPWGSGPYAAWNLGLSPFDDAAGISFSVGAYLLSNFSTDENNYPVVAPRRVTSDQTVIADYRPGNSGSLVSVSDVVDIGSSGPPVPPSLSIQDGSVLEGNNGTSRLVMTVMLSWTSNQVVTVKYKTANGTALANKDYSAVTNGTLTIQPGQTSGTIAISIVTDRKREPNETFSVQLSNAVGASISDAGGKATILNDD